MTWFILSLLLNFWRMLGITSKYVNICLIQCARFNAPFSLSSTPSSLVAYTLCLRVYLCIHFCWFCSVLSLVDMLNERCSPLDDPTSLHHDGHLLQQSQRCLLVCPFRQQLHQLGELHHLHCKSNGQLTVSYLQPWTTCHYHWAIILWHSHLSFCFRTEWPFLNRTLPPSPSNFYTHSSL